jgi:hypothetical protein
LAALLVGPPLVFGTVLGANQTRAGAFMSWPDSIAYWICLSLSTWWLMALATWMLDKALRPWAPPRTAVWLLGGLAGSLVARPAIYAFTDLFRPLMKAPVLRVMRPFEFSADFALYYVVNWSVVIAIWALSSGVYVLARRSSSRPADAAEDRLPFAEPSAPVGVPRLLSRLPAHLGHDLVALEAEDHYVRVHTRVGNALVLISLAEAIRELELNGVCGQRAHRSWWVVNDAVRRRVQRGRNLYLLLGNEIEVPVSTSYRQLVRSLGTLEKAS